MHFKLVRSGLSVFFEVGMVLFSMLANYTKFVLEKVHFITNLVNKYYYCINYVYIELELEINLFH